MDSNGRNGAGRFAPGNAGGPGRPRRVVERDYLAALRDAVSPADWRKVVGRALVDAKAGDARARDWLARYLIGTPQSDGPAGGVINPLISSTFRCLPSKEEMYRRIMEKLERNPEANARGVAESGSAADATD